MGVAVVGGLVVISVGVVFGLVTWELVLDGVIVATGISVSDMFGGVVTDDDADVTTVGVTVGVSFSFGVTVKIIFVVAFWVVIFGTVAIEVIVTEVLVKLVTVTAEVVATEALGEDVLKEADVVNELGFEVAVGTSVTVVWLVLVESAVTVVVVGMTSVPPHSGFL